MKIYKDFNLSNYNSYRINTICEEAIFPESEADIVELYKKNKAFILLGNGNNTILSKPYYNQSFVVFNGNYDEIVLSEEDNVIIAESGATTLQVSEFALKHSLTGAEFLYDIPSSIGGAVVMNAGTKEGETKNILLKVRFLDLKDMKIKEKMNDELELDYRNSIFQKEQDKIILKTWFQLEPGDMHDIKNRMSESKTRRWLKQPREYPNCGSVFKRPPGRFVGPMLDELGLKGYSVGGAQVSKKHSGFIINYNEATGDNILELIKYIKTKVKNHFDVDLEVEQRIV